LNMERVKQLSFFFLERDKWLAHRY
jgi:hypothetical protein